MANEDGFNCNKIKNKERRMEIYDDSALCKATVEEKFSAFFVENKKLKKLFFFFLQVCDIRWFGIF